MRQAQDLALGRGIKQLDLAVGGDLEDLAFGPGGDDEVARPVLDDVPDVHGIDAGQGLDLPRQPQRALAADHGILELGLFKLTLAVLLPDLDLGRVQRRRRCQNHQSKSCRWPG